MRPSRTLENHLLYHWHQTRKLSGTCLHISAFGFFAVLCLASVLESLPLLGALQAMACVVIATSIFVYTLDALYEGLTDKLGADQIQSTESADGRLETIGRLAGGVAHDFNNSLMVLLNCIEVMHSVDDSKSRQQLLADMESAARGAQSTAEQLMSLSREGSSPGQPSDPRVALRSLASNLRRMFPENITVRDLLRGTPPVALVSGQFEQVILNICLNAKDAMPNGGELTIRCFKDPIEDQVVIEIEDDADPSQNRQAIVDKPNIVDRVTRVGGTITARVLESGGTNITLNLPIAERSIVTDMESKSETEESKNLKALLVDDNDLVLTMLSTRLEDAGYDISTALSVQEAIELVENKTFDALVCDAVLTDGAPTKVIETFKKNSSGPIVICSGYPKNDPLLAELQTDSAVFLQKPFSTDELIQQLQGPRRAA